MFPFIEHTALVGEEEGGGGRGEGRQSSRTVNPKQAINAPEPGENCVPIRRECIQTQFLYYDDNVLIFYVQIELSKHTVCNTAAQIALLAQFCILSCNSVPNLTLSLPLCAIQQQKIYVM